MLLFIYLLSSYTDTLRLPTMFIFHWIQALHYGILVKNFSQDSFTVWENNLRLSRGMTDHWSSLFLFAFLFLWFCISWRGQGSAFNAAGVLDRKTKKKKCEGRSFYTRHGTLIRLYRFEQKVNNGLYWCSLCGGDKARHLDKKGFFSQDFKVYGRMIVNYSLGYWCCTDRFLIFFCYDLVKKSTLKLSTRILRDKAENQDLQ